MLDLASVPPSGFLVLGDAPGPVDEGRRRRTAACLIDLPRGIPRSADEVFAVTRALSVAAPARKFPAAGHEPTRPSRRRRPGARRRSRAPIETRRRRERRKGGRCRPTAPLQPRCCQRGTLRGERRLQPRARSSPGSGESRYRRDGESRSYRKLRSAPDPQSTWGGTFCVSASLGRGEGQCERKAEDPGSQDFSPY
jgi:hypothetical protein